MTAIAPKKFKASRLRRHVLLPTTIVLIASNLFAVVVLLRISHNQPSAQPEATESITASTGSENSAIADNISTANAACVALLMATCGALLVGIVRFGRIEATIDEQSAQLASAITRSEKTQAALRESKARFRTLIDCAPEAIVVFDFERGEFVDHNSQACELFGLSPDELRRADVVSLSPSHQPDGQESAQAAKVHLQKAADGAECCFEWMHRKSNGELIPCEIRLARLPDDGSVRIRGSITDITQRKRADLALQEQAASLRRAEFLAKMGHYSFRADWSHVFVSEGLKELYGFERDSNPTFEDLVACVHPEDIGVLDEVQNAANELRGIDVEYRIRRPDGSVATIHSIAAITPGEPGEPPHFFGALMDITQRQQVEEALRENQRKLSTLMANIPGMVYRCLNDAEWSMEFASKGALELTGWTSEELIAGNVTLGHDIIHPDDVGHVWNQVQTALDDNRPFELEYRIVTRSGETKLVAEHGVGIYSDANELVALEGVIFDASERRRAQEDLRRAALIDALTGLPNRYAVNNQLRLHLDRAARNPDYKFAVLFIDLDNFKYVNDSLGHDAGDVLLMEASRRLRSTLRSCDLIAHGEFSHYESVAARFGGDEFVVVVDGLGEPEDAVRVAQRVLDAMSTPCAIAGNEIAMHCSIGITTNSSNYTEIEPLLRDADTAMYRAKASGKGRYAVFDQSMHVRARERLLLENELRSAVEYRQFRVLYQPIVDLQTGRVVSFEALVRWKHPERGMVSPLDFIPIAEETGLIVPIGKFVLEQACAVLDRLTQLPGGEDLCMNVNVSRCQLSDSSFVDEVEELLRTRNFESERLRLEITESAVMTSPEDMHKALERINALGVKLHLDDFGTGLSSLSLLRTLPLDGIKIDRSFLAVAEDDQEAIAILEAIILLGRKLGKVITAEGIERPVQVGTVAALGCDLAQGYLYGRPASMLDIESLVDADFSECGTALHR